MVLPGSSTGCRNGTSIFCFVPARGSQTLVTDRRLSLLCLRYFASTCPLYAWSPGFLLSLPPALLPLSFAPFFALLRKRFSTSKSCCISSGKLPKAPLPNRSQLHHQSYRAKFGFRRRITAPDAIVSCRRRVVGQIAAGRIFQSIVVTRPPEPF